MEKRKWFGLYRMIKAAVRFFYPKMTVEGSENLPPEPVIVVGNHSQLHGPIACELYFPGKRYTWCAGQMMNLKEVPTYAFQDFWSRKPWYSRWFYKLLSYVIAPVSVVVFNNADTIPVYRDGRILTTFKRTVNTLCDGASVVVFPEHDEPYNHILSGFQDKFIDIARLYHKRSGKALQFVPLYIAPNLHKMVLGKPVCFDPAAPMEEERSRICAYLMESITHMACKLPEHTVVPYKNCSKKEYKTNRSEIIAS